MLCSIYFIRVLGSQASDRGWIDGIKFFGEAIDEKNNNRNFTDFSVPWNVLWFFQLGQFVRDTGRWNFLPWLIVGTLSEIKKSKAKSCFIRPLLQVLVGHNSISSTFPLQKKCCPWRRTPSYFLNGYLPRGVLTPLSLPPKKPVLSLFYSQNIIPSHKIYPISYNASNKSLNT